MKLKIDRLKFTLTQKQTELILNINSNCVGRSEAPLSCETK